MRSSRHIGIVAVSADGAALCYRTICHDAEVLICPDNFKRLGVLGTRYLMESSKRYFCKVRTLARAALRAARS